VGESPSDVAARSDVTITCVTATDDERAALMGAVGEPSPVIEGVRAGSMVLGMSTVSPTARREFEVQLAECGVRLLDSPISGGEYGRLGRTLSIMVGGETEALERARPILEATGAQITHCGSLGAGQTVKLSNQIAVCINNLAMAEALLFCEAAAWTHRRCWRRSARE
jgi:3-hydroxyisobutyrate dehydrogenase